MGRLSAASSGGCWAPQEGEEALEPRRQRSLQVTRGEPLAVCERSFFSGNCAIQGREAPRSVIGQLFTRGTASYTPRAVGRDRGKERVHDKERATQLRPKPRAGRGHDGAGHGVLGRRGGDRRLLTS